MWAGLDRDRRLFARRNEMEPRGVKLFDESACSSVRVTGVPSSAVGALAVSATENRSTTEKAKRQARDRNPCLAMFCCAKKKKFLEKGGQAEDGKAQDTTHTCFCLTLLSSVVLFIFQEFGGQGSDR